MTSRLPLAGLVIVSYLYPSVNADERDCPVTKPSEHSFVPPAPYKSSVGGDGFLYGTAKLWTLMHPGWRVHSGGRKLPYFRQGFDSMAEMNPRLNVVARRLDGDGPLVWNDWTNSAFIKGQGAEGMFMTTGVDIPVSGCWEITARYAAGRDNIQTLTYVVWVDP